MDSKIIFLEGVLWGVGEVATPVTLTVETTVAPLLRAAARLVNPGGSSSSHDPFFSRAAAFLRASARCSG